MKNMYPRRILMLVLGCLFWIPQVLFAQESGGVQPDSRLREVFKPGRINKMERQDPDRIAYLNFFLDHSWFISNGAAEKPVDGTPISSVRTVRKPHRPLNPSEIVLEKGIFNPLKYDFRIDPQRYTYYPIGNSGKVLVFYPQYILDEMFAKSKAKAKAIGTR